MPCRKHCKEKTCTLNWIYCEVSSCTTNARMHNYIHTWILYLMRTPSKNGTAEREMDRTKPLVILESFFCRDTMVSKFVITITITGWSRAIMLDWMTKKGMGCWRVNNLQAFYAPFMSKLTFGFNYLKEFNRSPTGHMFWIRLHLNQLSFDPQWLVENWPSHTVSKGSSLPKEGLSIEFLQHVTYFDYSLVNTNQLSCDA